MMKSPLMISVARVGVPRPMPLGQALVESSLKELVCSFPQQAAGGGGRCLAGWEPRWVETAGVGPAGSQGGWRQSALVPLGAEARWRQRATVEDGWICPEGETPTCPGCQTSLPTGGPRMKEEEMDALHRVYLCRVQSSAPVARGLNSPEPSHFPYWQVTVP